MKITKKQIAEICPCSDGLRWYEAQGTEDAAELVERAIIGGVSAMLLVNRAIPRLLHDRIRVTEYAVFAACQILRPDGQIAVKEFISDVAGNVNCARTAAGAASAAAAYGAAAAYNAGHMEKILRHGLGLLLLEQFELDKQKEVWYYL